VIVVSLTLVCSAALTIAGRIGGFMLMERARLAAETADARARVARSQTKDIRSQVDSLRAPSTIHDWAVVNGLSATMSESRTSE
jgi:hypothetical protein